MIYDTIGFIVSAKPNEYYGKAYVNGDNTYLTSDMQDLHVQIILNGVAVEWSGYIDFYSLALCNMDSRPYYDHWIYSDQKHYGKLISGAGWSVFYPFSCSCGSAGCAGIWQGIFVKVRGHSVEWRASRENGYEFLLKSFFNFNKEEYKAAFDKLLEDIDSLGKTCKLVVDPGNCEEELTLAADFLEYVGYDQR